MTTNQQLLSTAQRRAFSNVLDPHLVESSHTAPAIQRADCILMSDEILGNLCILGFEKWYSSKHIHDYCPSGELQDGCTKQVLGNAIAQGDKAATDTRTLSHVSSTLGPRKI